MQLKTLLLAGFIATTAMARGAPTKEYRNMLNEDLQQETTSHVRKRDVTLNTYVHVVAASGDQSGGNVPVSSCSSSLVIIGENANATTGQFDPNPDPSSEPSFRSYRHLLQTGGY